MLMRIALSLMSVLSSVAQTQAQEIPARYVVCMREDGGRSCGAIDETGAQVIAFAKTSERMLSNFRAGFSVVTWLERGAVQKGLIGADGDAAIRAQHWELTVPSERLVAFLDENSSCGYLDTAGRTILAPQWTWCGHFVEGRAEVSRRTRTGDWVSGFIDETGKLEIDYKFEEVENFSEGRSLVKLSPEVVPELVDRLGPEDGFIDLKGAPITDFNYITARDFSQGMAVVVEGEPDGRYLDADSFRGYINLDGELIWPIEFATADDFTPEGVALVGTWDHETRESEYGFVRADGTWALAPTFDIADSFSDGLAWVRMKDGWHGYIDLKGERVLPSNFDGPFSEGIAETWESSSCRDECGCLRYVDRTGEPVFPFALATAVNEPFDENGIVVVDIHYRSEVYDELLLHHERGIIWPPGWNEPGAGDPNVICWPELEREQEKSKKGKKKKKEK